MTQDDAVERIARERLRSLRAARGWSLDELGRRAHLSASTISRIETGHRRLALDQLVVLARALETTVDALLADDDPSAEDIVIHPSRNVVEGVTHWLLTRPDDPSGRVVAKMRLPASNRTAEPKLHPGREWFYVLEGTVRLRLGDREVLVEAGQAAEFDTMTPHRFRGHRAAAEVLSIFDGHGDRAHLR
jgi:transcriptional regulator with XRE-family HTH domain